MKSKDAKSCFLLCCLFPEDDDIKIQDLVKYEICGQFFQTVNTVEEYTIEAGTLQEARDRTYSVVEHLKSCSLLLDSTRYGCIRMNDVIKDVAMLLSEDGHRFLVRAGCQLKNCPKINAHIGYSAISLVGNEVSKLRDELVCPKLQILLLQENENLNEISKSFFQSPNELRVLNLRRRTSITSLTQSFSLLTNLQALYLDFCHKIIDFSILGSLKKLEILSMREYPLKELSKQIGNLTNLKLLDVSAKSNGCLVTIPSEVISRLRSLEELYLQFGFWDWGSKVEGEGEEANVCFDEVRNWLTIFKHFEGLHI